jgi:hypothetical protein
VKRYADLLGNKKKPRIKSLGDNKVRLSKQFSETAGLASKTLSSALTDVFSSFKELESEKLFGGAALQNMTFEVEGLGRPYDSTYFKYTLTNTPIPIALTYRAFSFYC